MTGNRNDRLRVTASIVFLLIASATSATTVRLEVGDILPRFDLLQPGVHRYLRYTIEGDKRTAVDIWTRRISFEERHGKRLMHIVQRWDEVGTPPANLVQNSWFESQTFRPLTHIRTLTRDGKSQIGGYQFFSDKITGLPNLPNNLRKDFSVKASEPAFNFEYDMELLQTLPLEEGYAASIVFYDPGRDPATRYVFKVAGSDRIAGPVGRLIDCWLVTADYNTGKILSRFWFDKTGQTMIHEEQVQPDGSILVKTLLLPETADAATLQFSSPEFVLEGQASVIRLAISPDGNRELWGELQGEKGGGLDIRQRRQSEAGWGGSEDVPFNTPWNDFDPAFTPDGSGIYFFSNRPGGEGGDDIWFVPLKNDAWGEPVSIGPPVNTPGNEWAPTLLADGRLLFSSDGHGGLGGQDLFIAERNDNGWSAPRNLGDPVNSEVDDYDAVFLDERALVFTRSEEPGGSDLYYSCQSHGGFTKPESAGPNVNLGGGWALGPSVSTHYPGVLFFSGRDADESSTRIYRARYKVDC